jgi:hypothetical protein
MLLTDRSPLVSRKGRQLFQLAVLLTKTPAALLANHLDGLRLRAKIKNMTIVERQVIAAATQAALRRLPKLQLQALFVLKHECMNPRRCCTATSAGSSTCRNAVAGSYAGNAAYYALITAGMLLLGHMQETLPTMH